MLLFLMLRNSGDLHFCGTWFLFAWLETTRWPIAFWRNIDYCYEFDSWSLVKLEIFSSWEGWIRLVSSSVVCFGCNPVIAGSTLLRGLCVTTVQFLDCCCDVEEFFAPKVMLRRNGYLWYLQCLDGSDYHVVQYILFVFPWGTGTHRKWQHGMLASYFNWHWNILKHFWPTSGHLVSLFPCSASSSGNIWGPCYALLHLQQWCFNFWMLRTGNCFTSHFMDWCFSTSAYLFDMLY